MSNTNESKIELAYLNNKLVKYRKMVMDANNNKKIFSIHGHYPGISKALKSRGWIEKSANYQLSGVYGSMSMNQLLYHAAPGNTFETILLTRLLQNTPPNFIWQHSWSNHGYVISPTIKNHINHMSELNFTTKGGLLHCCRNRNWHTIEGFAELTTPRAYFVNDSDELEAFWRSFNRTVCISLLIYITENPCAFALNGTVRGAWVDFAMDRVKEAIDIKNHLTIDSERKIRVVYDAEWTLFFVNYRNVVTKSANIKLLDNFGAKLEQINSLVEKVYKIWPYTRYEGKFNIWILKPRNENRGNGIILLDDCDKIREFISNRMNARYIIQKYIERPLLILRTKFDIRQHFLLTVDNQNETIWFYNNCYIRFSGQEFNIRALSTNIHLTNVSVQKQFKNNPNRNKSLPEQNMWSLDQFKEYLTSIDQESLWDAKIVPQMKRNIIAVVLCAQEATVFEMDTFELYGCDFLVTENYDVLLLEVNSNPNLSPSTDVNTKFFPVLLDDVIKVVVDKQIGSKVGDFERIFQTEIPNVRFVTVSLNTHGRNYNLLVKNQRIEKARRLTYFRKPLDQNPQELVMPIRKDGSNLRGLIQTRKDFSNQKCVMPPLVTYDYLKDLSNKNHTLEESNKSTSSSKKLTKNSSKILHPNNSKSSRLVSKNKNKNVQRRKNISQTHINRPWGRGRKAFALNQSNSSLRKIRDAIKSIMMQA